MKAVFCNHEIVVHIVGTETCPESIYPLGIECMPEVAIEFLSSIKIVEDIAEPVVLIDSDVQNIWNLYELR